MKDQESKLHIPPGVILAAPAVSLLLTGCNSERTEEWFGNLVGACCCSSVSLGVAGLLASRAIVGGNVDRAKTILHLQQMGEGEFNQGIKEFAGRLYGGDEFLAREEVGNYHPGFFMRTLIFLSQERSDR